MPHWLDEFTPESRRVILRLQAQKAARHPGVVTIEIFGPIDDAMADRVIARAAEAKAGGDIHRIIDSNGGFVRAGQRIYAALRARPCRTTARAVGCCASAAIKIFSPLSIARRYSMPSSTFMPERLRRSRGTPDGRRLCIAPSPTGPTRV